MQEFVPTPIAFMITAINFVIIRGYYLSHGVGLVVPWPGTKCPMAWDKMSHGVGHALFLPKDRKDICTHGALHHYKSRVRMNYIFITFSGAMGSDTSAPLNFGECKHKAIGVGIGSCIH